VSGFARSFLISKSIQGLLTEVEEYHYQAPGGQCYKPNTVLIYCHFWLNYGSIFYNIEFTLDSQ
jgi:hypothetical protein